MNDARRYRGNAVDCLLAAKACSDYRNILVSIAATWHALARQDEAIDMLLESWSALPRPSAQILIRAEPWSLTSMTVPHYINEDKSEMRGIKSGWYAMDDDGSLVAGPFDTGENCVGPTRRKAVRQSHALLVRTDVQ